MAGRLEGKVAIITGSTSGIGRATAELFAQEGCRVVVNGRRYEKLSRSFVSVGPELGVRIPQIRASVRVRYCHDFSARTRPVGGILVVEVSSRVFEPPEAEDGPR